MQATLNDLVHTGPGTLAGRYLRLFWQPILRSEDLAKGKAMPARIMGEDYTVYRGESGKTYVVDGRCAHRRTRLHTGLVAGETIRCLYHGWEYDHTGQCIFQPGERESFTKGIKISSFPTAEYVGLIWAYFGPGDPPPMRKYPDFERPGLISVGPPEIWPCNLWNRLDNGPDLMHVVYTHAETMKREFGILPQGIGSNHGVPEINATETDFGVETAVKTATGDISYYHFLMPNTNAVAARIGRVEGFRDEKLRYWAYEMFVRVPIDDHNCVSYHVSLIDLHGEEARRYMDMRDKVRTELDPNKIIISNAEAVLAGRMRVEEMDPRLSSYYSFLVEDYACQVGQGSIADRENEHLGQIDQGTALLRKLWLKELSALAEGRELTKWAIPVDLADKTVPQPSLAKSA
jgi:5,5'-dehydrodivanillate O-demethylase